MTDMMRKTVGLSKTNDIDGEVIVTGIYGKEVILDCYQCDVGKFNRRELRKFFTKLCKLLKMKKADLHFWDDVGVPKKDQQTSIETKGTSAVQFIITSNITVHCLDRLGRVYVNIFSCKDFGEYEARAFVQGWFDAKWVRLHVVYRD